MKISVITVCKNAGETLENTIKSVLSQGNKNYEYIVIDGSSTDNTNTILKKYKDKINIIVSEKDKGIYDAMNKGIQLSSGDYLFFLNANDTFYDQDVIDKILAKTKSTPDIIYGNVVTVDKNRRALIKFNNINRWALIKNTICHQAIFTHRRLFEKLGKYNSNYKIAADYDWLLNAVIKNKIKAKYVDLIITNFSLSGVSGNNKNRILAVSECSIARKKYFSPLEIIFFDLYSLFVLVYQNAKSLLK